MAANSDVLLWLVDQIKEILICKKRNAVAVYSFAMLDKSEI